MMIDNGNHLVLSGNPAVARYLAAIGAQGRLSGPSGAAFPYRRPRDAPDAGRCGPMTGRYRGGS